jgi:hypothetical protein
VRAADVFPNVAALYGGGARPSSGSCCVGGCLEHFLVGEEHSPAVGARGASTHRRLDCIVVVGLPVTFGVIFGDVEDCGTDLGAHVEQVLRPGVPVGVREGVRCAQAGKASHK